MKFIVSRALTGKLSCSSLSHVNPPFLRSHLLHSASGDEAYRRRNDGVHSFSSSVSRRHYNEDNRNVRITVWWDFENCNIPLGVNPHRVGNRITSAIRSSGVKGPVTINAFGDVAQLSRATQEALTATGISLTHVPHSGKNSADRSIMADIICWVSQNPPPAHFFLISSDSDFANILHRLRMINYNIFISCTGTASTVLYSAATFMWPWNGLVKGENVPVRHFNNPPDGLYGSWYGHYKRVPYDPFEDTDNSPTSEAEESVEPISEPKIRRVPKAVVDGILQVLHSYPEGISLSVLRTELKRNNISIDKDFYGHKNFSQFLGSLNLLKVLSPLVVGDQLPVGGGQPPVGGGQSGTLKKGAEQPDVSPNPHKDIYTNGFSLRGDSIMDKNSNLSQQLPTCKGRYLDANGSAAASFKDDHPMVDLEARRSHSVSRPTMLDSCDDSQKRDNVIAKGGLIFLLWNSLTGHRVDSILKKDDNVFELRRHEFSSKVVPNLQSADLSKDVKPKDEAVDMNNLVSQNDNYEINSVDADRVIAKDINPGQSEKPNFVCEQKVNLFGRIVKCCKSIIYGANDHADHSESGEKVHKIDAACSSGNDSSFSCVLPEAHELFTEPSFWNDLESYLLEPPKGGQLMLKSRTREQLLRRLQNEGPSSLKKLDDSHLSRLGHILISEKKWVEESPSQKFPYKLVIPLKNDDISSQSSHLNDLCSLFPTKTKPNSDKQSVQEKEDLGFISTAPCNFTELRLWFQKHFNSEGNIEPEEFQKVFKDEFNQTICCSFYGYSNISGLIEACSRKSGPPRREEVLDDCRKLLKELLEKNPTGFNIRIFQLEFLQKYGYILNYNSLGYPKLMKLLQIMPGIKIENNYACPSEEHATDISKEEDYEGKKFRAENGNFNDSAWDVLGPISSSTNHENDEDRKMVKEATFTPVSLSDEVYTDFEEEDTPMPPKRSAGDNSLLLKILDSWDDNKEGGTKRQQGDANDMVVDCSRNSFQKKQRTLNVGAESLQRLKLRANRKRFSFVTKDADNNEYFAKSILSELRKAGDLKVKEPSR